MASTTTYQPGDVVRFKPHWPNVPAFGIWTRDTVLTSEGRKARISSANVYPNGEEHYSVQLDRDGDGAFHDCHWPAKGDEITGLWGAAPPSEGGNAWGLYCSPSRQLVAFIKQAVHEQLPRTPLWALDHKWYTQRREVTIHASSGSLLARVDVDADTITYSERLTQAPHCGQTVALGYDGPQGWTPTNDDAFRAERS